MKPLAELQAQYNDQRAHQALTTARNTLESALHELDRYAARFEDTDSPKDKAAVLNWTLNHLACNITPNLRLDLLANAQADLTHA